MGKEELMRFVENSTDEDIIKEFKDFVGKYVVFAGEDCRIVLVQRVQGDVYVTLEGYKGKGIKLESKDFAFGYEKMY